MDYQLRLDRICCVAVLIVVALTIGLRAYVDHEDRELLSKIFKEDRQEAARREQMLASLFRDRKYEDVVTEAVVLLNKYSARSEDGLYYLAAANCELGRYEQATAALGRAIPLPRPHRHRHAMIKILSRIASARASSATGVAREMLGSYSVD